MKRSSSSTSKNFFRKDTLVDLTKLNSEGRQGDLSSFPFLKQMIESDFNSLLVRSLNSQDGWGYKIPDTFSIYSQQRNKAPYDIFGYYRGHFICCESKWLQQPKSFPLTRLEDHQLANLIKCYEGVENSLSLFLIGVDFGRGDRRCFVWKNKDLYYIKERKELKKNFLKKDFEILKNFVPIKKNSIDFNEVLNL